ncbi:hypothetical protein NKI94_29580 [Mesorhizobium australicum]|uniref:hypothetical protein n=1 Tax=Mesorhizobium australicum TaxID=536018 RepID=UPI00333D6FE8
MAVDDSGEHVDETAEWLDIVEFAGLCRPWNYAECLFHQAVKSRNVPTKNGAKLMASRRSSARRPQVRSAQRRPTVIYAINYDLKRPGRNYEALHEAIKNCGDCWHFLGSTWLVDTALNAQGVWSRLEPNMNESDFFLVIGVTRDYYQAWLPQEAWDWIDSRSAKLAA